MKRRIKSCKIHGHYYSLTPTSIAMSVYNETNSHVGHQCRKLERSLYQQIRMPFESVRTIHI